MPELGKIKHQIKTMLALQDELNSKIHPKWREQNYPWRRAIWCECAELLDHYGYKWWKKQEPDMDQVKLEVVDIWHFILSYCLQHQSSTCCSHDPVIRGIYRTMKGCEITSLYSPGLVYCTEKLAEASLSGNLVGSLRAFFFILHNAGMTMDELFNMYVGKYVLNNFRQNNGYKEGSYQKTWGDKEDNEHLSEILKDYDMESDSIFDDIYKKLEDRYALSFSSHDAMVNEKKGSWSPTVSYYNNVLKEKEERFCRDFEAGLRARNRQTDH